MRAAGLLGFWIIAVASAEDRPSTPPVPTVLKWPQSTGGSSYNGFSPTPASSKIKLSLSSSKYRSASQGPIMKDELASGRPVNLEDLREIDEVIDRASRTHGWSPIIPQYSGRKSWAWTQWEGTIVERLVRTLLLSTLVPALLVFGMHLIDPKAPWLGIPDEKHPFIAPLLAVSNGWNYLLTLTTFVTTFFVGHSHDFWRKSYSLTRIVQGRFNDIGLLAATHAARTPSGVLTDEARECLKDLARELRLAHMFFWSDVCYRRSVDFGASIRVLLSMPALDRLLERGLLTQREHDTLLAADLPPSRWYLVVLEWVMCRLSAARAQGLLTNCGAGWEQTMLGKCCELRGACMGIPDELAARMPLAYVHFTHLLVDALLLLAPFALYAKLGAFAIVLNGIIALFYRGLLELSKSFLE